MPTTCGRTRSTPAATASLTLYPRLTCISPRPYALRIMPTEGRDSAERQKYKFGDKLLEVKGVTICVDY